MRAWNYLQKTSDLPLRTEIVKQRHKIMMEHRDGKDVLIGEYRKNPVFSGFKTFAPASTIERLIKNALHKYCNSDDDPISAAANLFVDMINVHPFEGKNRKICHLILAHVLIQMKFCLFPVILSSFHGRGRRHYIRAVKMFDRKPSMLYTMIVKSLIHCWKHFEQNSKILARC